MLGTCHFATTSAMYRAILCLKSRKSSKVARDCLPRTSFHKPCEARDGSHLPSSTDIVDVQSSFAFFLWLPLAWYYICLFAVVFSCTRNHLRRLRPTRVMHHPDVPSSKPSEAPSESLSAAPSPASSEAPSDSPSSFPSEMPSLLPSLAPSEQPYSRRRWQLTRLEHALHSSCRHQHRSFITTRVCKSRCHVAPRLPLPSPSLSRIRHSPRVLRLCGVVGSGAWW